MSNSTSTTPLQLVTSHPNTPNARLLPPADQKEQAPLSPTQTPQILSFDQFKACYAQTPRIREGFKGIEILYRNNVLWARATLFKHCVRRSVSMDYASPGVIDSIREAIRNYST